MKNEMLHDSMRHINYKGLLFSFKIDKVIKTNNIPLNFYDGVEIPATFDIPSYNHSQINQYQLQMNCSQEYHCDWQNRAFSRN